MVMIGDIFCRLSRKLRWLHFFDHVFTVDEISIHHYKKRRGAILETNDFSEKLCQEVIAVQAILI